MIEGFYGGKFFPMHKGHAYCISVAAEQCDHVTVILFVGGEDEEVYLKNHPEETYLTIESRTEQVKRVCKQYNNVDYAIVDVGECRNEDGSENWDAETALVRKYVPKMDYVYSSETAYGDYFKRAYPEATHIVVDEERKHCPVSATQIRTNKKNRKEWMV